VVRTPDEPRDAQGNMLVLAESPVPGGLEGWLARFAAELPDVAHRAFAWDGPPGDTDELVAAGFIVTVLQVMVADAHGWTPARSDLQVRTLTADEVVASHTLAFAMSERHGDDDRARLRRRASWHAGLVARNAARFYGAFDHDELVASLGLVELGDVARFQDVQTAAAYRRRGLATALIAAAASAASAPRLVIVAEPGGAAARLYERVGFRTAELAAWAWR
jgi:predicted GNAT family acetyltransferase